MATNYSKGRAYEYKAKKLLEEQGYTVLRTAGSHGPWDILAFRDPCEPVRCIQIKSVKSERQRKKLLGDFLDTILDLDETEPNRTWKPELWVWQARKWHISS